MFANFSHQENVLLLSNMTPFTVVYKMRSSNNLAINYYPPTVYDKIETLNKFAVIISIVGLSIFALSLFRGKVVGLELTATLQVSYFGLVLIKDSNPLFYRMGSLIYTNGYNLELSGSTQYSLPINLQAMFIYQSLI